MQGKKTDKQKLTEGSKLSAAVQAKLVFRCFGTGGEFSNASPSVPWNHFIHWGRPKQLKMLCNDAVGEEAEGWGHIYHCQNWLWRLWWDAVLLHNTCVMFVMSSGLAQRAGTAKSYRPSAYQHRGSETTAVSPKQKSPDDIKDFNYGGSARVNEKRASCKQPAGEEGQVARKKRCFWRVIAVSGACWDLYIAQ